MAQREGGESPSFYWQGQGDGRGDPELCRLRLPCVLIIYFLYILIMSMQQLLILGRATKDAEVLESKEGKEYGRFTVVVNEYRGKDKEEVASYFNVLVFNKTVKNVTKIQKGDYVMVEGRPKADPYLSNDGEAKANMSVFSHRWKVLK